MLHPISRMIARSRTGRYWLHKLANHVACAPLVNIAANQVPAGLSRLRQAGFSPQTIVDIGAHRGEWTRSALAIFPTSRFLMIEAQPDMEASLARLKTSVPTRVDYRIALLGPEAKDSVAFHLADTGSSLYVENTAFARTATALPMTTLDALLDSSRTEGSVFLKLDVQGAELDVLAGAGAALARAEAILAEVSIAEYNHGAPRIAEVVAWLRERDFLAFDIWDLRRIDGTLAQIDLLFVRQGSPLEQRAAEAIRNYGRETGAG